MDASDREQRKDPMRAMILYQAAAALLCATAIWGQQQPSATGPWQGTFADSVSSGKMSFDLRVQSNGSIGGTYTLSPGGSGTVTGNLQGSVLQFILAQSGTCSGAYTGTVTLENGRASGTYWGNDCQGKHENGAMSMVKAIAEAASVPMAAGSGSPSSSSRNAEQTGYQAYNCRTSDALVISGTNSETVERLKPGDSITVLERQGMRFKVRTATGVEGYVMDLWVCKGSPPSPTAATRPDAVDYNTIAEQAKMHPYEVENSQYPLRLKILQTEQVPYTVQVASARVNTNCSINGGIINSGTAITFGDTGTWTSYSYPDVRMSCSSYEDSSRWLAACA